ncbi:MAG: hypothetical protein U0992_22640 [Planctomycetaceae bacterium]
MPPDDGHVLRLLPVAGRGTSKSSSLVLSALYHTVLHEDFAQSRCPPGHHPERPYHLKADVAFRDLKSADYAGMFISGGAPEYLRYDKDLLRVTREISRQASRSPACVTALKS